MTDRTVCEHFNELGKCDDCQQVNLQHLRDQFAMAALQGLLTSPHRLIDVFDATGRAYMIADAMMEARKK